MKGESRRTKGCRESSEVSLGRKVNPDETGGINIGVGREGGSDSRGNGTN